MAGLRNIRARTKKTEPKPQVSSRALPIRTHVGPRATMLWHRKHMSTTRAKEFHPYVDQGPSDLRPFPHDSILRRWSRVRAATSQFRTRTRSAMAAYTNEPPRSRRFVKFYLTTWALLAVG